MKRHFSIFGLIIILLTAAVLIPSFRTQSAQAVPGGTYKHLKLFNDILALIESKYVEEVDSEELIQGAIEGMLRKLDPHSAFLTPEFFNELNIDTKGEFGGLGIEIMNKDDYILIIAPIDDTPAAEAGVMSGDLIVAIDRESTKGLPLLDAVKKLRGKKGTKVTISVMREGVAKPFDITITRDIIKIESVKSRVEEDNFLYVRIKQFNMTTHRDLKKSLSDAEKKPGGIPGLVLDLRNNPGGLLSQAIMVSDLFLEEGKIVYTSGRDNMQNIVEQAKKAGTYADFPIVVLINDGSASASEIVAGALQDHKRAVLVGTKSFGKGSVQTIMRLDDGSGLKLTTAKYFTPLGRDIQAKGITPDIVIEASPYANIDPAKRRFYRERLKERDLENHLLNKDENGEPEIEEPKDLTAEEIEAELGEDVEDYQLQLALELLRSWDIFQSKKAKSD